MRVKFQTTILELGEGNIHLHNVGSFAAALHGFARVGRSNGFACKLAADSGMGMGLN